MVSTTGLFYPKHHDPRKPFYRFFVMNPPSHPGPWPDPGRGVYGISVAAELVGSAPQNLRLYEARGLIHPTRSEGGTRRYSEDDLARLRQIGQLLGDGLNLAGVAAVLALRVTNEALQVELDQVRRQAPPQTP
jgi:MerR family transcriptional regulator/heat shock protein HspR